MFLIKHMNKYTYIHIDNETLISGWLGLSVFHLSGKKHYKSLVAHKKLKNSTNVSMQNLPL